VPRAAESLLAAAVRTTGPENRLTELLATTLALHGGFRDVFLAKLAVTGSTSAEVRTQVATENGFVDLELVAWSDRRRIARVWVESKLDAEYQHQQLQRYADSLKRRAPPMGILVNLVPRSRVREAQGYRTADVLSWQWLAEEANKVGAQGSGGKAWRSTSRSGTGTASQRLLDEFLGYLEAFGDVSLEPLSMGHAVALRDADTALRIATELFDRAVEASKYAPSADQPRSFPKFRGVYQHQHLQPPSNRGLPWWPEQVCELYRDQWDKYVNEPTGEPAFFVGAKISSGRAKHLREASHREWLSGLEKQGFALKDDDPWTRLFTPLYLAEIAARASTLDLQVEMVARWIDTSLDTLIAHPPRAGSSAVGGVPGTLP